MKKLKIIKSVLGFISLSQKSLHDSDVSKEELSPNTLAIKRILDPNNVNLPEPSFEDFEKVSDFANAKQRKSIYNNQMSLFSNESSDALLKKGDTFSEAFQKKNLDSFSPVNKSPPTNNNNDFKIRILPLAENPPMNSSVNGLQSRQSLKISSQRPSEIDYPKIENRSKSKTSHSRIMMPPTQKKAEVSSLKNFSGAEEKEISGKTEEENKSSDSEKSESSDDEESNESLSKESESDSIDVIEEEEDEEDNSSRNSEQRNTEPLENPDGASELMSNREKETNGLTQNAETDSAVKKTRNNTLIGEANNDEIVEELDTLEDDINPNIDMNLLLDVYEDSKNFNRSQKLRNKKLYKNNQWVIYPDDTFKSIWSILLSLVLAYTCLVTPYRVAFLTTEDDIEMWFILDWFTDSIFWFDILMNFVSAYYDNNDNLIVEKKLIIVNYISGWLIPDVVGVLPFDYFFDVSRYGNLMRVAKLPRLYKLVRMTKMIRVLKLIKERNTVIKYLMDLFSIGTGFERLFVSICSIFVFCHLACCFWYMAADLNDNPINWINQYDLQDKGKFDLYIASFYWITQTVVTVGYGDITAANTLERCMACVYMFVGVFFYSFTIGSLSSLLSSMDSKNATFDQKLNTLIQIRNQYNLDSLLYNRVKRALKYGATQKDGEKITFLNELPLNLRIELSVIMHRNVVQGVEFFRNKPATFIALIGPYLKPFSIGKDEYIFQEGEYADEMYFIKEGEVSIVLKDFNNFEFMSIAKGYHFGEVDLLFGDTRKYTYMASTDVQLLALSKKDFTKIFFTEFREIGCEMFTNANKRRLRASKYHKEAIDYCIKQHEKKRSYFDHSSKGSMYGFRPMISMAKKSNSSQRGSEFFKRFSGSTKHNESLLLKMNMLEIPQPQDQEIKESEEKAKLLEAIIEENSAMLRKQSSSSPELPEKEDHRQSYLAPPLKSAVPEEKALQGLNSDNSGKKSLARLTDLMSKSPLARKRLGLDNLIISNHLGEQKGKDLVSEGIKQMDIMEDKMKSIENKMDEIFQFYKSLGIETEKPQAKETPKVNKKSTLEKDKQESHFEEDHEKENGNENAKKEEKRKEAAPKMNKSLGTKIKTLGIFKNVKGKKN